MNRLRAKQGYTIVELLVVIAVLAVVSSLATRALFNITSLWSSIRLKSELHERAGTFFDTFRRDIDGIIPPNLSGRSIVGTMSDAPAPSDSIEVPAMVPSNFVDQANYSRIVTYRVARRDDGLGNVVRMETPLGGPRPGARNQEPRELVVLESVRALRIEYAGPDGHWDGVWNADSLPRAVRVSVVFSDPDSPLTEIVRTAVFPVKIQPNTRGQWGRIIVDAN